jgi:hypothetical protein
LVGEEERLGGDAGAEGRRRLGQLAGYGSPSEDFLGQGVGGEDDRNPVADIAREAGEGGRTRSSTAARKPGSRCQCSMGAMAIGDCASATRL